MRLSLSKLIFDRRGNALIMFAASMPLLIGAAAIGLDTIQVTVSKDRLQRIADSAALAGAHSVYQGATAAPAVARDLEHNNVYVLSSAPTVENSPSTGPFAGDSSAVSVTLQTTRSVPFIGFFTGEDMLVRAHATAARMRNYKYCIVSLESSAATGITFAGNSATRLGCGIATNSTGPAAVAATGSSSVTASPIAAVGAIPPASNYGSGTEFLPGSIRQPDPFGHLANPTVPPLCSPSIQIPGSQTAAVLTPGCYKGILVEGTVTFAPGVYVIDGGSFDVRGNAVVNGTGVTFILTSASAHFDPSKIATLAFAGEATLNLTAPTSGTYEGLLFYQDRRATGVSSTIRGRSTSNVDGGFYFPSTDMVYEGNAGLRPKCLRIVSRRVTFSGSVELNNNCPASTGRQVQYGFDVRLVG